MSRYNRYYNCGSSRFYLSDFYPTQAKCRILVLKILEQAVREYCSLFNSTISSERNTWELARDFIFDDKYRFIWGDIEISTETFLNWVDLDIKWVREQTKKKLNRSIHGKKEDQRWTNR